MDEEYIPLLLLGVFLVTIVIIDTIGIYQVYIYYYNYYYNTAPPDLKLAVPVSMVMTGVMYILLIIYAYKKASTEEQPNNTKIKGKVETI